MRRYALLCLIPLFLATTSCQKKLVDERFPDNHLGQWTVIDEPDCLEAPSRWQVEEDGWLHQKSNIWGLPGDFIGRWYGTLLVTGKDTWGDYRISFKARSSDDDGFGVVFRFQNPEHFYRLVFVKDGMSGGPMTRLDKRQGPDYTEIWSERQGFQLAAEMFIELEAEGDTIRARVNGRRLFEVRDAAYARGKVGLFCYAQNGQAFDDFMVVSL